jgi:transposase
MLPSGSTLITDTLSVVNAEGRWTYFQGVLPVFTHAADDHRTFQMFAGQLAANGHCKLVEIERAFGVSAISVKRMVKRYREGGCEAFFAKRRVRGASVLTDAVVVSLQALLDAGLSYRAAAIQLGIKSETVRKGLQHGVLRAKKKRWAPGRTRASAV